MLRFGTAALRLSLPLTLLLVSGACTSSPTTPGPVEPGTSGPTPPVVMPWQTPSAAAHVTQQATRPMTMRLTVELVGPVDTPLPQCLFGHFRSVIVGRATHLGNFRGFGSTCILTLVPDADPPFQPPGPPPYFTATFSNPRWVLTAASGAQLWLEAADAVAVLGGVNPEDGSYTSLAARGTHRILGGTGRFAGAGGELQTAAVNEDGQGPDDGRSEGWIRY